MQEVFIKYNPYKLITEITIDGEPLNKDSMLNVGEKRLQEWIEDLPVILKKELCTKNVKLKFSGTKLDYEDVDSVVRNSKNINIELEYLSPESKSEHTKEAIEALFKEIRDCPYEELEELNAPDVVDSFNAALDNGFKVNVIATMSAGKSTLINALLCKNLMPAKQEACTATITEIKDNDGDHFEAEVYDKNDNLIRTCPDLTCEIMKELNDDSNVSKIYIQGDIPFVEANDVTALVLVDTPGPNSASNVKHREATYKMLTETSKTVVLYIMNMNALDTVDEAFFLNRISEDMQTGGKLSRDRFIFVINKLDAWKKEDGDIKTIINVQKKRLEEKYGIKNPNVYPASALTALEVRTLLSNRDDDGDEIEVEEARLRVKKFVKKEELHLNKYASLDISIKNEIDKILKNAEDKEDINTQALVYSGVIPIELAIKKYVQKYAEPIKIKNIVDTLDKRIKGKLYFENLKEEITSDEKKGDKIAKKCEEIGEKVERGKETKKIKKKIKNYDCSSMLDELIDDKLRNFQNEASNFLAGLGNEDKLDSGWYQAEIQDRCNMFNDFAKNLMIKVRTDLEVLVNKKIIDSANELLKEYREKIMEFCPDVDDLMVNHLEIAPMQINNMEDLANKHLRESNWEKDVDGVFSALEHFLIKIAGAKYLEWNNLSMECATEIENALRRYATDAKRDTKEKLEKVMQNTLEKTNEFDRILEGKMKELTEYKESAKNNKGELKRLNDRLNWLTAIQKKVNAILEI